MIPRETQRANPNDLYTRARAHLAALCGEVTANREVVIVQRRGAEDVALVLLKSLMDCRKQRTSCDLRQMPNGF